MRNLLFYGLYFGVTFSNIEGFYMQSINQLSKFILVSCIFIFLHSSISSAKNQTLTEDEACRKVHECLLHAYLDLYFDQKDGTFPRGAAQAIKQAHLPKSFTSKKAEGCGRGDAFSISNACDDTLTYTVAHGDASQLGFIQVVVERANYAQVKEVYEREKKEQLDLQQSDAENIFEWYQLHHQA